MVEPRRFVSLGVTTDDDDALLGVSSSLSLFQRMGRVGGDCRECKTSRGVMGDALFSWLMLY